MNPVKKAETFEVNIEKISSARLNNPTKLQQVDTENTKIPEVEEINRNTTNDYTLTEFSPDEISEIIGNDAGSKLSEKKWQTRKDAIDLIRLFLSNRSESRHKEKPVLKTQQDLNIFKMTIYIIYKSLNDSVLPIYFSGIELLHGLIETHLTLIEVSKVLKDLSAIVEILLHKMVSNNARITREAMSSILFISKIPDNNILIMLSQTLTKDTLPIRPRLQILRLLIQISQFKKGSGFTIAVIMSVTISALESADEKTRKDAMQIVVDCYKAKGDLINQHLTNVRPAILKTIQQKCCEYDESGPQVPKSVEIVANSVRITFKLDK